MILKHYMTKFFLGNPSAAVQLGNPGQFGQNPGQYGNNFGQLASQNQGQGAQFPAFFPNTVQSGFQSGAPPQQFGNQQQLFNNNQSAQVNPFLDLGSQTAPAGQTKMITTLPQNVYQVRWYNLKSKLI